MAIHQEVRMNAIYSSDTICMVCNTVNTVCGTVDMVCDIHVQDSHAIVMYSNTTQW